MNHEDVDNSFFLRERTGTLIGVAFSVAASAVGYLIPPLVAVVILLALPIFSGITSEGLFELAETGNQRAAG